MSFRFHKLARVTDQFRAANLVHFILDASSTFFTPPYMLLCSSVIIALVGPSDFFATPVLPSFDIFHGLFPILSPSHFPCFLFPRANEYDCNPPVPPSW